MRHMEKLIATFSRPDYPVFTVADAGLLLKREGVSRQYLHLMLHNLAKRGKIARITRGIYTFHEDAAVVGFAFQPFYYGLESALWLMGMSGQGANFVVMTPRNVRAGMRSFKGRNYRVQRIGKELMFGYGQMRYGKIWIPVSDLEKTVIDMVSLGYHISEELLPEIRKKINSEKLNGYLKRCSPEVVKQLAEALGLKGLAVGKVRSIWG